MEQGSKRKRGPAAGRPTAEERLEVILPAHLKRAAAERAAAERLPLSVFARLAIERALATAGREAA